MKQLLAIVFIVLIAFGLVWEPEQQPTDQIKKENSEQPQDGDVKPDEGDVKPDEGDAKPDEDDAKPDEGDVKPDEGDVKPDEGDAKPDEGDVKPQDGEKKKKETSFLKELDAKITKAITPYTTKVESVVFYSIPVTAKLQRDKDGKPIKDANGKYLYVQAKDKDGKNLYVQTKDKNGKLEADKSKPIWEYIKIPFVLIWLVVAAVIFTLYMGFVNIRGFGTSINIVRGVYSNPDDKGEVSHFQALTAALSGTVGLGNIAGVAIAVSLGGPGATFWMILAGIFGMSSKFVECTLGVKYREINEDGSVSGGPMYYLSKGLAKKGLGFIGLPLAVFFALMCIGGSIGGGNMFQVNQAFQQFQSVTGGSDSFIAGYGWLFGVVMAGLVAIVIIGGIKSIANVTDKIVPFMCTIYVIAALVILVQKGSLIGQAFGLMITGAFAPMAVTGGFVGVLIQGFKRAAFSNEAGIGSASIAHSAVKTNEPVTEGLVALLEPFIDTVVVCTMTALVIIITGIKPDGTWAPISGGEGIDVTSEAFASVITWFPYVLCGAVMLFAFSTMVTWSYYGLQAWEYLFGRSKFAATSYKIMFCLFVVIGASLSLKPVVGFSDAMIFAMCFPNVIGLYLLSPEIKKDLKSFMDRVKSGEIKRYK